MIENLLSVTLTLLGILHLGLRKNLLAASSSVNLIFMGLAFGFANAESSSSSVNEATAIILLVCGVLSSSLVFALERRARMRAIEEESSDG